MKDRLKKKIKTKKILATNKVKAKPVKRKEYPMPPEYNKYLKEFTELLDSREEYNRMLPTLPPETRREAIPLIRQLDESLGEFEQRLADEYENFQKREARIEELEQEKEDAATILFEHMQRGFILMKHKLPAETFQPFEKKWVGRMGKAEREEFYELVAHRESYDLENILAYPNGYIQRPMKHPLIQMHEARFEIDRVAYVTPDDFKKIEAEYEKALAIRDKTEKKMWIYNPEHRPLKCQQIEELDRKLDELLPRLMKYLAKRLAETGKVEVENPDEKKLDAAFELSEIASQRVYLMIKHTTPHLLEGWEKASFQDLTPEELAETRAQIAKREAEELDKILASLKPPEAK